MLVGNAGSGTPDPGGVGVNDLSLWLTRYGLGLSAAGCTP